MVILERKAVSEIVVLKNDFDKTTDVSMSFLMELKSASSEILEQDKQTNGYGTLVNNFEAEFEEMKKSVGKEVMLLLAKRQSDLIDKINPINKNNFEKIKTAVIKLVKDVDPEFQNFSRINVEKCENPTALFTTVKSRLVSGIQSFYEHKLRLLCQDIISLDEFDDELLEINFSCVQSVQNLINLFTPKTVNPKVLKLEKEVKDMGVSHVDFSDDFEQGRLIKEAILDLIKTKMPLPESVTVSNFIPFGTRGYNITRLSSSKHNAWLLFTTSEEKKFNQMIKKGMCELAPQTKAFKDASLKMQTKYLESMHCILHTMHSTNNPKHQVYHEVAHSFSSMSLELMKRRLSDKELEVAKSVSHYAASSPNGREVVPEIFAKLMDKQEITPAQMKLYKKLGGIIPHRGE